MRMSWLFQGLLTDAGSKMTGKTRMFYPRRAWPVLNKKRLKLYFTPL